VPVDCAEYVRALQCREKKPNHLKIERKRTLPVEGGGIKISGMGKSPKQEKKKVHKGAIKRDGGYLSEGGGEESVYTMESHPEEKADELLPGEQGIVEKVQKKKRIFSKGGKEKVLQRTLLMSARRQLCRHQRKW